MSAVFGSKRCGKDHVVTVEVGRCPGDKPERIGGIMIPLENEREYVVYRNVTVPCSESEGHMGPCKWGVKADRFWHLREYDATSRRLEEEQKVKDLGFNPETYVESLHIPRGMGKFGKS